MPKRVKEKSALEIRKLANQPGMHSVGGVSGLYLVVGKNENSCSWILKTVIGEKRRELGLGPYPEVSLKNAREEAAKIKKKAKAGKDPIAKKEKARAKLKAKQAFRSKQLTLKQATIKCHRARLPEFKNKRHQDNWIRGFELYVFDQIGELNISQIETGHVVSVLEPIWQTKTETASKLRQRIETVWFWAKVAGYCSGENPAKWRGHLDQLLPAPSKIRQRKHHAALPWEEIPAFMANLRAREGVSARALEFKILTASRSGEVRFATWDEIDTNQSLWTIPKDRMKAGKQHRVPLSEQALAILAKQSNNLPYLFPAPKLGPLSDMSLSAVTRRMGVNAVPHGLARSSFKDWARAKTNYPDEVSELALAHVGTDATRAAYARNDLLDLRRNLMSEWAHFCSSSSAI